MKRRYAVIILAVLAGLAVLGYTLSDAERSERAAAEAAEPPDVRPDAKNIVFGRQAFTPVIDPGHGGADGGAVSITGAHESGINLDIALRTALLLRFLGVTPVMTRETDISIHDADKTTISSQKVSDIHNRTKLLNSIDGGVLISIHQNMFEQRQYRGAQVFYGPAGRSAELAAAMQAALRVNLDPGNTRQPKTADFYLLKNSQKTGILVECGFLSNHEEETLLRAPVYQRKLALVMAAVLCSFAA